MRSFFAWSKSDSAVALSVALGAACAGLAKATPSATSAIAAPRARAKRRDLRCDDCEPIHGDDKPLGERSALDDAAEAVVTRRARGKVRRRGVLHLHGEDAGAGAARPPPAAPDHGGQALDQLLRVAQPCPR